jgi:hypothetical protein
MNEASTFSFCQGRIGMYFDECKTYGWIYDWMNLCIFSGSNWV